MFYHFLRRDSYSYLFKNGVFYFLKNTIFYLFRLQLSRLFFPIMIHHQYILRGVPPPAGHCTKTSGIIIKALFIAKFPAVFSLGYNLDCPPESPGLKKKPFFDNIIFWFFLFHRRRAVYSNQKKKTAIKNKSPLFLKLRRAHLQLISSCCLLVF